MGGRKRKGRDPIDRELQRWEERLSVVNIGLLACFKTIAEGQQEKADLEAKIASRRKAHVDTRS